MNLFLPAGFGDDHFGAESVKFFPQIFGFETDFGVVGDAVVFGRRQSAERPEGVGGGGRCRRGQNVFGRRVGMRETDRGRMGGQKRRSGGVIGRQLGHTDADGIGDRRRAYGSRSSGRTRGRRR